MTDIIEINGEKIFIEEDVVIIQKKESGIHKEIILKKDFIESIEIDTSKDYTIPVILGCVFVFAIVTIYTYFKTSVIYFYISLALTIFFVGYIIYYSLDNDIGNKIIVKTSNNVINLPYDEKLLSKLIKIIENREEIIPEFKVKES